MVDISVVTGTWNRLNFLKKMVTSARAALGPYFGLTLDFVVVDGGSTDGTQAWCVAQPDITFIEHGKLLGAIRAFNDGAAAATGTYVILANDDIEFIGNSIWLAWQYMQAHSDCGIGCFYQDRDRQSQPDDASGKWQVEVMPVVIDGHQASAPYGQVCIVPRWLGNRVGWWGDPDVTHMKTYGGDNELSSQVYEVGYKISPVPQARIHDASPDDQLRGINNITGRQDPRAVAGHHPDSWAWGRRWRGRPEHLQFSGGRALVGPLVRTDPIYPNPVTQRDRVLYLPIFEQGYPVQREQKRGLRDALAEVAIVDEFDYVGLTAQRGKDAMLKALQSEISTFGPTFILSQLHNADPLSAADIFVLRQSCPGVPWVNWNGDYWPNNLLSAEGIALARMVDLQLTINRSVLKTYQENNIRAAYWQIGWEPDGIGQPPGDLHDVVFLASGYSKDRQRLVAAIRGWGLDFALYGSGWPEGWASGQCLYDFKTGCSIYRGAKISMGDSQWPDSGFVSNRVFQALAAGGAALAHQWFAGMDELGLVDGQTCIVWHDPTDLRAKITHYLAHENERCQIADAGEQLALTRHSFQARVKELYKLLERTAPASSDVDDWRFGGEE